MDQDDTTLESNERRAAPRKKAAFAVYTAPAMMVMLASKKGNAGRFSQGDNGALVKWAS